MVTGLNRARQHLPEGWTIKFRKGLSYHVHYTKKRLIAPFPRDRRSLLILLAGVRAVRAYDFSRQVKPLSDKQWAKVVKERPWMEHTGRTTPMGTMVDHMCGDRVWSIVANYSDVLRRNSRSDEKLTGKLILSDRRFMRRLSRNRRFQPKHLSPYRQAHYHRLTGS